MAWGAYVLARTEKEETDHTQETKHINYNYTVCRAMGKEKAEHSMGPLEVPYRLDRVSLSEEAISKPRLEDDD